MSSIKRCLTLSLVALATCSSSLTALAQYEGGYGWPAGDCSSGNCGGGGHFANARAEWDQLKADSHLICQRNAAWPLPFQCWDRAAYYTIMNQQFAHGLQVAHTLTSEYFDPNTNELNKAGEARVAWIMQNSPVSDRKIFVYEDQSGPAIDRRIASIRTVVDQWYGHMGGAEIASSQLAPNGIPASYQAQINQMYSNSMPQPIIPVTVGSTVQAAASGN
jgi:hypothetical protein